MLGARRRGCPWKGLRILRGADILVNMLNAHGVEVIFGLPGDTSMAFYDALRDSGIRHVLARDERSAGYMADAYARLSDRPGVVEAPSGGGATYLLPAAAEANDSAIPMILLTSDTAISSDHRASITSLDQEALYRSSTKRTIRVMRPVDIPHLVRLGFRSATAAPGGAAHLAFPEDVLSGRDHKIRTRDLWALECAARYPAWRVRPSAETVERVVGLALAAERPLVLAGGGVHLSRAGGVLLTLAEHLGAGIVTTMDGKGSMPEDHPQVLGVIGGNGAKEASNRAVTECDLLLAFGTKLNSTTTWGGKLLAEDLTLVHIDADPAHLGLNARPSEAMVADARCAAEDLLSCLVQSAGPQDISTWLAQRKASADEEIAAAHARGQYDPGRIHPGALFGIMEEILPRESVLIADAGTPTPYLMAYYRARGRGRTTYAARSHGSLGYALPAALGARMARPADPVVALVGDGSLSMTIGELETLADAGGTTIVVHFRNESYGWIKMLQKLYYEERYHAVDFPGRASFVDAATALGARASYAQTPAEFRDRLTEAGAEEGLHFIEVRVPPETELTPPVAAWQRDERVDPADRRRRSY